eukprot:UN23139
MKKGRKPIVFILDDFDEFATRNKQSLLYTLFDLQQKADVQVMVIGTTTRCDAFSLLEKRNRSRFSDRKVIFPAMIKDKDKMKLMFEKLLSIPDPSKKAEKRYNKSVKESLSDQRVLEMITHLTSLQVQTPKMIENILIDATSELDENKPMFSSEMI